MDRLRQLPQEECGHRQRAERESRIKLGDEGVERDGVGRRRERKEKLRRATLGIESGGCSRCCVYRVRSRWVRNYGYGYGYGQLFS
jgi:hypothetical protein